MAIGVVGSAGGTTNFDVLSCNELFCAGTITGSVQSSGTETITSVVETNIDVAGTITGTKGDFTNLNVSASAVAGKVSSGIINSAGTMTGTYVTGSYLNAASIVGSHADVKGTVTGTKGDFTNLNVSASAVAGKVSSGIITSTGTVSSAFLKGTLDTPLIGNVGVDGTMTGTYLVGSYLNAANIIGSQADVKGTVTGTKGDFTNLNVSATATPGKLSSGIIESAGTVTGTYINGSYVAAPNINCAGTVTGTYINGSYIAAPNVNAAGTITGTYINGSYANAPNIDSAGTITGSFVKGTFAGDFTGSTVKVGDMLCYNSGLLAVTNTKGTLTHGLGAIPSMVLVTPVAGFAGTTAAPLLDDVGSAWFTVVAGTTGTAYVYAIA